MQGSFIDRFNHRRRRVPGGDCRRRKTSHGAPGPVRNGTQLQEEGRGGRSSFALKASPYSITDRRVPELIPVLGSQPAGDVSHKPGGRLPLLSARPAVTPATLKRGYLLPVLPLGEQKHSGCEQFA